MGATTQIGGDEAALYFHHVGQRGSDEDFPKTVVADVNLGRYRPPVIA